MIHPASWMDRSSRWHHALRTGLASAVLACAALLPRAATPAFAQAIPCSGPTASAAAAKLCGTTETVTLQTGNATVNVFRGVRYATAARWQAPQGYTYAKVDTATSFGPVCPQPVAAGAVNPPPQSEDCLYLNVWAPQNAAQTDTTPVMVFIHGGAFVTGAGSSPLYDGSYLAASGNVVVVTLNYRLGPLGFLYVGTSGKGDTTANFGIRDQRQALMWVQNNIRAFGGDPSKVTLFGESAGAMSVGLHLFAMPSSKPLFRAAIMESNPMGVVYRDTTRARKDATVYLDTLCNLAAPKNACPRTMAWMQGVKVDSVLAAAAIFDTAKVADRVIVGHLAEALPWAPAIDSTLILQEPYLGYAEGMTAKPLVFGMNKDEGVIFAAMAQHQDSTKLDAARYYAMVEGMFPASGVRITTHLSGTTMPYSPLNTATLPPLMSIPSRVAQLITDYAFAAGNLGAANRAYGKNGPPVYGYLFRQQPFFNLYAGLTACAQNRYVCHAYELPYVFNTLEVARVANGGNGTIQDSDRTIAGRMVTAWTTFARTLGAPEAGWQPYTPSTYANGGSVWVLDGTTNGSMISTLPTTSNASQLWFKIWPLSATTATGAP